MILMLYEWPTWQIVIFLLVVMLIANQLGYRVGIRGETAESELSRSVSNALKGSVFGLVALLLAFCFSATNSRFELRQRIVLDQANAIGTCYQRAGLLDDVSRDRIRATLRRYLEARFAQYRQADDDLKLQDNQREVDQSLSQLWTEVENANRENPDAVRNSLIIPSANEVIDLSSTRSWANRNNLPLPVLTLLLAGVIISAVLLGHSSGQSGRRHLGLWIASNLVFSLVLYIVLDFDRPRRGLIQVDPAPLLDVFESMSSPPPTA